MMRLRDWFNDLRDHFNDDRVIASTPDRAALEVVKVSSGEEGERLANLEMLRPTPARSRGGVDAATLESFAEMVRQFDPTSKRNVYQDADRGEFLCLFNDDGPVAAPIGEPKAISPGWRDHYARFEPKYDESWAAWTKIDGVMRGQLESAEFIQERLLDFREPDGATMLEIAQQFDVERGGHFKSGLRLSNGMTRLSVENTAKATAGTIDIPEVVELGMRVFRDEQAYPVKARFRWRILTEGLRLGFKIIDRDKLLLEAIVDLQGKAVELLPNNKHIMVRGFPKSVTALGAL